MSSEAVSGTEMDSGTTSIIPVCVNLTDVLRGLQRDIVLLVNTIDGTALGIVRVHSCLLSGLALPRLNSHSA